MKWPLTIVQSPIQSCKQIMYITTFKENILIQYAVCVLSKIHTYYFLLHLCR